MPAWPEVDWARPWLQPWRVIGERVLRDARQRGLVAALNEALLQAGSAQVGLAAGRLQFVPQTELPRGEAYEAYVARSACVPTRDNLHDFFNGLAWLAYPALKRRLNELQSLQLAAAPGRQRGAVRGEVRGAVRGAVRDALTLFDENAALWAAPTVLADALRRRDWHALFVTHRQAWAASKPPLLFGHALLEKLVHPRKPITAHVWMVPSDEPHEQGALRGLGAEALARKPFLPLPVLGVPGWWPGNLEQGFYDDATVFRRPATANVQLPPE